MLEEQINNWVEMRIDRAGPGIERDLRFHLSVGEYAASRRLTLKVRG